MNNINALSSIAQLELNRGKPLADYSVLSIAALCVYRAIGLPESAIEVVIYKM